MLLPRLLRAFARSEQDLEAWLLSSDTSKQNLAAEALAQMGPETKLAYLQALARREERKRTRRIQVLGGIYASGMLGFLFITIAGHGHHHLGPFPVFVSPMLNLAIRTTRIHRKANELLAAISDIRVIPSVVDGWRTNGFTDANIPARCLARLLPLLKRADITKLTGTQWKYVLHLLSPAVAKLLKPDVHHDLVRAVLLTCGNLGMVEALPQVRTLADAKTRGPEIDQLKQTARNYVTLLENASNPQMVVARR